MAAKRKSKTARAAIIFLCTVGFFLIFLLGSGIDITEMAGQIWNSLGSSENTASAHAAKLVPEDSDSLLLYIIDTGNSDSMVLRSPDGHSVLIDAGESDDLRFGLHQIEEVSDAAGDGFGIHSYQVTLSLGAQNDLLTQYGQNFTAYLFL